MSKNTKVRLAIAALVFMMLQAGIFGIGILAVLLSSSRISDSTFFSIPAVIAISCIISAPIAWWLAPHLRARYWRREKDSSLIRSIS